MAVVWERVFLRRSRKTEGERRPHRIKLDKVSAGDCLVAEIFFSKKNNIRKCYRFRPEQLTGRKSVAFSVSGNELYWLRGLKPENLDPEFLPKDLRSLLKSPEEQKKSEPAREDRRKRPKSRKLLVFDADQKLVAVCRNLETATKITHILPESIQKLCKSKKPSQDTGLFFRSLWKKLDISDFTLTVPHYDEMCKRKPRH